MAYSSRREAAFLEVFSNQLLSVAEEMTAAMIRSAYSPAIRDRHDCSSALLTLAGDTVAQAADLPIHLGALVGIAKNCAEHYGLERLEPGDVLLANDPYEGASTHLNDISAIAPIFWRDRLVGFACVTAHHSDVGGARPGSETLEAETIFQEGLRLPCMLVHRRGETNSDVVRLVMMNSRTPNERSGDLRAQVGAVLKGVQRFGDLVNRYGIGRVEDGMREVLDRTEARFRATLLELPDGEFTASELLDPQRRSDAEVRITVRVSKHEQSIMLDFTGTSAQIPEGRNLPFAGLLATVNYAVRSLVDPEMPANDGFFRSVDVVAPSGCLVNPRYPSAVSGRVSTAQYVAATIFQAVASAWPGRAVAGCDGRRKVIFSGIDPRDGAFFVYHESNAGGVGAHQAGDGLDGAVAHVIQILNLPVEILELRYPLSIARLELLTDSGGAGRWRGGAGVRRDYVVEAEVISCSLVSERSNMPMWGLEGGAEAPPGRFVVNPGRDSERCVNPMIETTIVLRKGDVLSVQTAGGGGFGDPRDRPLDCVIRDVREGRVSPRVAREEYGRVDEGRQEAGSYEPGAVVR